MTDLKRTFDPFWMWTITEEEREEVVKWLHVHGVNPEHCARFTVEGWEVKAEMYELNAQGQPVCDTHGNPKYRTEDRVFTATWWPSGVQSELPQM